MGNKIRLRRLIYGHWRLVVLRQKRIKRIEQGKMLSLNRQRFFRNRHRLRRHRERQMADNRANRVLLPVINGEIRTAASFKPCEISEVNPCGEIVFGRRGTCWRGRVCAVAEYRQAETRRDHPQ